jgi:phage-related protein
MPYDLRQWPASVYPGETRDFPEALPDIDVALGALQREGPKPDGHAFKPLGKKKGGLWQLNLRASGRQIRILYAPYDGTMIIVFRIHKKSSQQEQQRAYSLAMERKRQAEQKMKNAGGTHDGIPTIH